MNQEDKKRFARYRKGYISSFEDDELLFQIKKKQELKDFKQKQSLGYIDNISINSESLINNITNKNNQ